MSEATQTADALPRGLERRPCLVMLRGERRGAAFWFEQDRVLIGRDEGCTVRIDEASVSRRHAELRRGSAAWLIADLGSKNGTRLNDRPLHAETPMTDGDICALGAVQLQFFMVHAERDMPVDLIHGALRLDLGERIAHVHDRACQLTDTESRLLAALLRRPSRPLSTVALMHAAYPEAAVVSEATVTSHLRNLRRKLGAEWIHSVYGQGYRLGQGG